ncbi:MAG TPA: hypothetical protein VGH40_15780 [Roseiarcus sp.]
MRPRWPAAVVASICASSAACAAPATSDGAKAIEQAYVEYFSKAVVDKGIVSVAPSGEDYLVTWDLQKALELADPSQGALRIDRFAYRLTPNSDGGWTIKADRLPSVTFDGPTDKGQVNAALDLSGFTFEAAYAAARPDFLRSVASAEALEAEARTVDPAQRVDVDLVESGVSVETRAKTSDSGAGVDVAIAQSTKRLTETVHSTPSADESASPITFGYEAAGMAGGLAIAGLRAREIGDLWKYVVAHFDDDDAPDLKQHVRAALPFWNDFRADAEIDDLELKTPVVEARLKTLGEKLGLTGFTEEGSAEFGVRLEDLAFKSALLPSWAQTLSPVSLNLDLRVADKGLDTAAQIALDDPEFGEKGALSTETQNKIDQVLLGGEPRLVLAPGRLTTPVIDLAFQGDAELDGGAPRGHLTVSADSLDKTIALLQEVAKDEPDAQSIALGMAFVKGLATTGADGRLVWKIDATPSGDVLVNGTLLPMGK